jgi:hypothetical protein
MVYPNLGNDVTGLVVASQRVIYLDSLFNLQKPAPSEIMSRGLLFLTQAFTDLEVA